jgi:hypothetical protein
VAADCQPAGPIEEELARAPVAFVGTVTETIGSTARLTVREVWAGDIGPVVEIRGLGGAAVPKGRALVEAEPIPIQLDDRAWTVGATYLVVPWVEAGRLIESACTATTLWREELGALRPAEAVDLGVGSPGASSLGALPWILVGVAGIAAVSVLAFRRSR